MSRAACKIAVNSDTQSAIGNLSRKLEQFDEFLPRAKEGDEYNAILADATKLDKQITETVEAHYAEYQFLVQRLATEIE